MSEYPYKAICHTKCYWLDTLWDVGEIYEGEVPPIKHFSQDGVNPDPPPPETFGDDPRSNIELIAALKKHPYNFTAPKSWSRKQIWAKFKELERAWEIDALTNPDKETLAPCGFVGATKAGTGAHIRKCSDCQEILKQEELTDGDTD